MNVIIQWRVRVIHGEFYQRAMREIRVLDVEIWIDRVMRIKWLGTIDLFPAIQDQLEPANYPIAHFCTHTRYTRYMCT